jgi:hypothetical protein
MASPTSRSLALLRKSGWIADIVERWLHKANRRRDLFGCIDLVAVRGGETGVLGVQTTSLANVSARVKKSVALPALEIWLAAGNRFEVHGWALNAGQWRVKRVEIRPGDMKPVIVVQPPRRIRGESAWQQGSLFEG